MKNHVETLYIEPGSPWENGYIESFNGKLRDDVLNREVFYSVKEARVIVENWRLEYNNHRSHSGLGYMTPAAFAAGCIPSASPMAQPQEYKTGNVVNSLISRRAEFHGLARG
jgi:putative transposase